MTKPAISNGNGENRMTTTHIKQSCKSILVILNILHLTSHYSYCQITHGPNRVKTNFYAKSVFFDYVF